MHPAFERTDHRPWPLPERRWTWRQTWLDLLFAHWPVAASAVRDLVPPELEIDEFEGSSWVGVVPFRMAGVTRRHLPDIPGLSAFPELNVRLYVRKDDRPGVWFLSLDASKALAVWAARRCFHLPYHWARMQCAAAGEGIRFHSVRRENPAGLAFGAEYRPCSEVRESLQGTLEHWLTERYCLYSMAPDGRLFRCEVHHAPWPLQSAECEIRRNEILRPSLPKLEGPPHQLHFARRIDVVIWPLELVT